MVKEQLKRGKKVAARFAIISDVHMTHIKEGYEPFKKTMELFSQMDVDGYVYPGDLTYMVPKAGFGGVCPELYPKAYDLVNELIDKYAAGKPKICAIGNHEYPQATQDVDFNMAAIRLFEEKLGNKINDHIVMNGYHFITIGGWLDYNIFSEETEEWAMAEIDRVIAEDKNKPVFVVFHKPPYCTVVGSAQTPKMMSEKFRNFLNSRQQIINITGDLHKPAQEPKTIWQDGFTVIHAPMNAVGNIIFTGCTVSEKSSENKYSQAMIMDIENDVVSVYRIDTIEDAVVGDTWTIDVKDKSGWKYTDVRFETDIVPYFEEGTELEANYLDGVLNLKVKDAVCPPNDIESFAQCYYVKIKTEEGEEILSEKMTSEFYLAKRSGFFTYSKEIELNGKYKVEISPESSFYKIGRAIACWLSV